ncbi:MAG: hypothetical protein IPK04_19090 [Bdellovibrionales bacterium]|nr:hypothetical protein [Bdellovibrionales bacterium]
MGKFFSQIAVVVGSTFMGILLSMFSIVVFPIHSWAAGPEEKPVEAELGPKVDQDPLTKSKVTGNLDETLKEIGTYKTEQFINLTLGIEQDIKLPALPSGFEIKSENLKGDFRKIVAVSVNKELGVLRFNPKHEGICVADSSRQEKRPNLSQSTELMFERIGLRKSFVKSGPFLEMLRELLFES